MARLPPSAAERARAYLRGEIEPVPARDAATVVLLRDSEDDIEVYLLRRQTSMAFAPQMHVFPGGVVEGRDGGWPVAWVGPDPDEWGRRLGCEATTAFQSVLAAVRETFEETGVLLAGPTATEVVTDTSGPDWERDRAALAGRELTLPAILDRRSLMVRSDLLTPWAHWLTPEFEPRRYDTRFFVAALPPGQDCRDVSGEADDATWLPVTLALEQFTSGNLAMLPPTETTLRELSSYNRVADVLADQRTIKRLTPRPVLRGEDLTLEWE